MDDERLIPLLKYCAPIHEIIKDYDINWLTAHRLLKRIIDEIGIDKLVFATDCPWTERFCKYKQQVDMIRNANYLTTGDKEKFLSKNVEKFLNKHAKMFNDR